MERISVVSDINRATESTWLVLMASHYRVSFWLVLMAAPTRQMISLHPTHPVLVVTEQATQCLHEIMLSPGGQLVLRRSHCGKVRTTPPPPPAHQLSS